MNFKISGCLSSLAILLSGCANQEFKAEEPVDYKDNAKYGFGSLIKGKDSVIKKYFGEKISSESELSVEKLPANTQKDKLWNATIIALKDFPTEFMDKKSGKIVTEKVKVKLFDNTETCTYKIAVTLRSTNDVDVLVTSSEDSVIRLKKHAETIRAKILEEYKR